MDKNEEGGKLYGNGAIRSYGHKKRRRDTSRLLGILI